MTGKLKQEERKNYENNRATTTLWRKKFEF